MKINKWTDRQQSVTGNGSKGICCMSGDGLNLLNDWWFEVLESCMLALYNIQRIGSVLTKEIKLQAKSSAAVVPQTRERN